jgi:hypothetical protein
MNVVKNTKVWGAIYRLRKVADIRPRGVLTVVFAYRSKGCFVRLGINQRVFKK